MRRKGMKILAVLLSVMIFVLMMPVLAFAGETEEAQTETVAEEQVVEEAIASTADEPDAEVEGEAETEAKEPAIVWDGYDVYLYNFEGIDPGYGLLSDSIESGEQIVPIEGNTVNFKEILDQKYKETGNGMELIEVGDLSVESVLSMGIFVTIKTVVNTVKAVNEDTAFKFELGGAYLPDDSSGSKFIDAASLYDVTLLEDTVVVKKGASQSDDSAFVRVAIVPKGEMEGLDALFQLISMVGFIKMKNGSGYIKDPTVYGFVDGMLVENITPSLSVAQENPFGGIFDIKTFRLDEYGNSIAKFMSSLEDDSYETLASLEYEDEMVFTAKVTKKGVQTGDENNLGLWIALMAISGCAAGALALKRK